MLLYRLFDVDGEGVGQIHLANPVDTGDVFFAGHSRKLRVVTFVPVTDEESPYDALLVVEPPDSARGVADSASFEPS